MVRFILKCVRLGLRWFFRRRTVVVELGLGDALDRLSILEIKISRIGDDEKREKARLDFVLLRDALAAAGIEPSKLAEYNELLKVNGALWHVEDLLRGHHEKLGKFGAKFVELARSVYQLNDERAAVKKAIDTRLGSLVEEVKSYV